MCAVFNEVTIFCKTYKHNFYYFCKVIFEIVKEIFLELTNKSKLVKKPHNPTRAKIYQVVEIDKNAEDADVESMASSKKVIFSY